MKYVTPVVGTLLKPLLLSCSTYSGTYNNHWMIVDFKALESALKSGLDRDFQGVLTVLEQLPGRVTVRDQSLKLLEQGYWMSYNRAYYNETVEATGTPAMVEKYGDWFTYERTPRAKIFRREQSKVGHAIAHSSVIREHVAPSVQKVFFF